MRNALVAVLLLSSCAAGNEVEVGGATPSPTSLTTRRPPPKPIRYETLTEAAAAIGCSDLEDVGTGGNAGLAAFGVCYVGRHNIDIYLTSQRSLWEHITNLAPSVVGPNWIIVCPTGADTARHVQGMIGGRLRIPATS